MRSFGWPHFMLDAVEIERPCVQGFVDVAQVEPDIRLVLKADFGNQAVRLVEFNTGLLL